MAASSEIFCASAPFNGTIYGDSGVVYSAPLSANGIGTWTESALLPKNPAGCSASGEYGYCFGGGDCSSLDGACPSTSYYSLLSSNNSAWTLTTDLPTSGYGGYVTADSYEYYFANSLYFAHLSAGGIGEWTTTTPFPGSSDPSSCVSSGSYIYCLDANSNAVYFARVSP
jgi:hypothetical protein